jgi:hypothetical protein
MHRHPRYIATARIGGGGLLGSPRPHYDLGTLVAVATAASLKLFLAVPAGLDHKQLIWQFSIRPAVALYWRAPRAD